MAASTVTPLSVVGCVELCRCLFLRFLKLWAITAAFGALGLLIIRFKGVQCNILVPLCIRLKGSKLVGELCGEVQHALTGVGIKCTVGLRSRENNITLVQEHYTPTHVQLDVVLDGVHIPCSQALDLLCPKVKQCSMLANPDTPAPKHIQRQPLPHTL
jgi:hypothetical protein